MSSRIRVSANRLKLVVSGCFGAAVIIAATMGQANDFPDSAEKINLSRDFAVKMAILKNIDLKVEKMNSEMAATDVLRNRSIYDTVLSLSSAGGVSYLTGTPFFQTRSSTSSISLTQYVPTGGSIAASTQTGYTNAVNGLTTPDVASEWQSSVGITITQPLLKNAGRETMELGILLAANTHQETEERLRAANADTVAAVISSYNRLFALRQNLESRTSAMQTAQTFLDKLKKRKKPSSLQKLEIANTEYAISLRRRELVDGERNVRDQEAILRYLIGMEKKVKIIPVDPPSREEPKETQDEAIKSALELRPDLRQLKMSLKSSQLQERVSKHQTMPELSVTASGGVTGTGPQFGDSYRQLGDKPSKYWSAGMQLTAPLGNSAAENDYRRSRIRTEQVEQQIKALSWRVRNDIESDLRALISARLQIQTADRSLTYAEQRLDEYRKNIDNSSVNVQDLINAENDLTNARNAQAEALEGFSNAVVKLWKDSGLLLDRFGVKIETVKEGGTAAIK